MGVIDIHVALHRFAIRRRFHRGGFGRLVCRGSCRNRLRSDDRLGSSSCRRCRVQQRRRSFDLFVRRCDSLEVFANPGPGFAIGAVDSPLETVSGGSPARSPPTFPSTGFAAGFSVSGSWPFAVWWSPGAAGMIAAILSFSTNTYPKSVFTLNMLSSYATITPYNFCPFFNRISSPRAVAVHRAAKHATPQRTSRWRVVLML